MKIKIQKELERRKRKAMYGTRAHSKILEAAVIESRKNWSAEMTNLGEKEYEDLPEDIGINKSWKERIIIS